MIGYFFANELLIASFAAMAMAQLLKSLIHWNKTGSYDWWWLLRDAGMPSAHTATVTALTFAVYWSQGATDLFYVTFVFAAITIRNVIGDKIFAEKTEHVINHFFTKLQHFFAGERVEWKHFIGHTLREVVAGFFVGLATALAVHAWFFV